MIVEAYILVTMSIAFERPDVIQYSEPITQSSCVELKRNVDAMITQANHLEYRSSPKTLTRCVPASIVLINSIETNTTNKIIIRK